MKVSVHCLLAPVLAVLLLLTSCNEEPIGPTKIDPLNPIPSSPPADHKMPVANAGNDTTIYLPFVNHTLNGSNSKGFILVMYQWRFLKGPSGVFIYNDSNTGNPKRFIDNLSKTGVYEFELTVADYYHFTSKDTMTITIAEPNCTSGTKEVILKDLKWEYDWYQQISITNFYSYLPANSHIKSFYIKRDASDKWELVDPIYTREDDQSIYNTWDYRNFKGPPTVYIYSNQDQIDDTPDVKIEYCN
jgi:hypothetical protein